MTGRTLADRYELVERRGTGGMAEVWEAIDHNLGRRVAVKMLHAHLAAEPTVLERFRSEAQSAARLTHPGIVGIYDTVTTESTDAIIMELVAGRDLRTILDERPTLAMPDAVEVGVQLAAALGHAHQHGIIHRDIKPANILVRPDRRVKLSDFGIAKALDATSHTESGSLVGTVKYLAPEQIEGHPVDARTDLYGLTTVLYEMLCGEVPFNASDLMGAMNRIRKAPPSARKLRPDLPPSLDAFLQKGLARNPADRYPDAETWSAQLTEAVRGNAPAVGEGIDPTVAEIARPTPGPSATRPASIPMRPAPSAPQQPVAGPGPQAARPARRPTPPVVEAPSPAPVAKHVKPKRRVMAWLGPIIAMALAIATVATVWFLLRPASTTIADRFGDEDNTEVSSSTSAPDDSNRDSENGSDSGDVITDDVGGDTATTTTDVASTGDDSAGDGETAETTSSTSTTTTTTTLPEFSNGIRSLAFDPLGDNAERNETASLALDGDPTTFWLTETYKTRQLGQLKEGVGLIVELETPRDIAQLRVLTDRVDWSVSIYEADAPAATIDGWDAPLAQFSGLGQDEVLDLPDTPSVTSMLVWITDLGLAPDQTVEEYDAIVESGENAQRLQIFELELIG